MLLQGRNSSVLITGAQSERRAVSFEYNCLQQDELLSFESCVKEPSLAGKGRRSSEDWKESGKTERCGVSHES